MNINKDKIVQLADTDTIENLTSALSQRLIADQLRLTTAESCTGGKLASALCAAEDTPKFYGAGFVTFTDQAGNDSNLLIVFYVQIMPDDFVMQLHR
ncbi:CinA family protein, partial [Escherichia coli]|uniref:CinA family protein n=2 Tax=Escherichia coli TaxID=562 RepID=UPI001FCED5F1